MTPVASGLGGWETFSVVLFLAALFAVPWQTLWIVAALWFVTGLGGFIYSLVVARRMARHDSRYGPFGREVDRAVCTTLKDSTLLGKGEV